MLDIIDTKYTEEIDGLVKIKKNFKLMLNKLMADDTKIPTVPAQKDSPAFRADIVNSN